jgi:hypothetical protein
VKLQELKEALRHADPAAVLVSQRLLARVIQEVHHLSTQFLQVPHHRCFVIDRQILFRHVEQDELDLDPDRMLPSTVILLVRPSSEEGDMLDRSATLLKYWQRLFHASVDRVLQDRVKAGKLGPAEIQARVAAIGEAEFDEIRGVLGRDLCLLPPADDLGVYCEFVAQYLELRYFLPNLRSVYFPASRDFAKIDALIAQDVDADAIYRATRLAGAPDPTIRGDSRSDDSHDYYWRLVKRAEAASSGGNHVRAAILRMRAARVAPGALTVDTRTDAHLELQRLTHRLQAALSLNDSDAAAWQIALVSLLEKADQGSWTGEARLLYDLQQVCIDQERDVYKLDLVEWVLSAGKRPIKRPLPSQRLVQMTRHLRAASQRIPAARLSDADRQHLTGLIQGALSRGEEQLRARFRPILTDALHDVGLVAANPPEETAFRKVIEELLDRIIETGFFTFGDLRDVIARNNLKLPDLADPQEYVRGDPLLRLDRWLAAKLDGVYRSGEVYLRVLARTTSLFYGTLFGRFLTRNILLPFGGAAACLWALYFMAKEHLETHVGALAETAGKGIEASLTTEPENSSAEGGWFQLIMVPALGWIPLGLLILGFMYLPRMRRSFIKLCGKTGLGLRALVNSPIWLMNLPQVQRVWNSWIFQLLWWFVLKPLAVAGVAWLLVPKTMALAPWVEFGVIFGAVMLVLNSQIGRAASEFVTQAILAFYDKLRTDLLEGLLRWILQLLKQGMDLLERLLYSIDEWLRFRSGDSKASLVVRTMLGVAWYPVSFITRLYVVVMIEPMFHPLKLPVAILAAKVLLPVYPTIYAVQMMVFEPVLGYEAARVVALANCWLSGDLFGFLFWEFTENWRLYKANRSRLLKPVLVGNHGETVLRLLKPGFHSGTVPRLFDNLRHAERTAMATGQWRTARAYRHQLHEVENAFRLFVERELLVLLHQSRTWHDRPLRTGRIELATRLLRLELEHAAHPGEAVRWAFAETSGWLTVQIEQIGWLTKLGAPQKTSLVTALAGWYKMAGADVVREQMRGSLAGTGFTSVVEREGLALHLAKDTENELMWPIHDTIRLNLGSGGDELLAIAPAAEKVIFAKVPITWDDWVTAWLQEQKGLMPNLLPPGLKLIPDQGGPPEGSGQAVA